ncbi:MAG: hypothetical protein ACUVTX_11320 [Bacteroidales bacterium]
MRKTLLLTVFSFGYFSLFSQSFFTQNWVEYEGRINNNREKGERTRVNDRGMSTHPVYSKRYEGQVNGLALVNIRDTILQLERAELFCELWGGHPGTANKRFQINGGSVYNLPSEGTAMGNCEYLFPIITVDYRELVTGINAIQFVCDRGNSFWGHFLMEEIAVNCYYKNDAPFIRRSGLSDFKAIPVMKTRVIGDEAEISLGFDLKYACEISEVHYLGYYPGYDWNGSGNDSQWHGYQFNRKWTGHIGTATESPYTVTWDTRLITAQGWPMAVRALIVFKNGINYWSEILDGITFSPERPAVNLIYCSEMPVPFWSRNKQLRTAKINLTSDPDSIAEAYLLVRIWDGGEGTVSQPFKMNGVPYKITTGFATHDLVCTVNPVLPDNLRQGENLIELYSDTEHHGIEICLPGPALIVRYR